MLLMDTRIIKTRLIETKEQYIDYCQHLALLVYNYELNPRELDLCEFWTMHAPEFPAYGTPEFERLYEELGCPRWDDDDIPHEDYATSGMFEIGWRLFLPERLEANERTLDYAFDEMWKYFAEVTFDPTLGWNAFGMVAHATNETYLKYGGTREFWLGDVVMSYNSHCEDEDDCLSDADMYELGLLLEDAEKGNVERDKLDYVRKLFIGEYPLENDED